MRQRRLPELEDQQWLPDAIRNGATDYLAFLERVLRPYAPAHGILSEMLTETGAERIVDLCSGAGGPLPEMLGQLTYDHGKNVQLVLTDKFPSSTARERFDKDERIQYRRDSVDASKVELELTGVRTLFTAFHHFAPAEAKQILRSAARAGQPIAVFELTERSCGSLLRVCLLSTAIFVLTPFLKPASVSRWIFTYLIPAIPFVVFWDGIASSFRSYTLAELLELSHAAAPDYVWSSGKRRSTFGSSVTYLTGRSPHPPPPPSPSQGG